MGCTNLERLSRGEQHRRLAVRCLSCGARVVAPVLDEARGTPFGPRLHAVATYLKTFQVLFYERLQTALSDLFSLTHRYTARQGHAAEHQTCLAHLARDVAYVVEASDDPVPWRLQLWPKSVFTLAGRVTDLATATLSAKRWTLDRQLGAILATPSRCDLTRDLQAKIGRARNQLLTFLNHPGRVTVTNTGSEPLLCPAGAWRKMTNGYRAMWAAAGEADIRTVVDTERLTGASPFGTILKTIGA